MRLVRVLIRNVRSSDHVEQEFRVDNNRDGAGIIDPPVLLPGLRHLSHRCGIDTGRGVTLR
jgi:hypothetical protein